MRVHQLTGGLWPGDCSGFSRCACFHLHFVDVGSIVLHTLPWSQHHHPHAQTHSPTIHPATVAENPDSPLHIEQHWWWLLLHSACMQILKGFWVVSEQHLPRTYLEEVNLCFLPIVRGMLALHDAVAQSWWAEWEERGESERLG